MATLEYIVSPCCKEAGMEQEEKEEKEKGEEDREGGGE